MKNLRNRTKGFTLVEIMIVVLIIGVLMAIAIPNFLTARKTSQTNACIANLKQIQSAKEQFLIANPKGTLPTTDVKDLVASSTSPNLPLKSEPKCPAGGTYTVGAEDVNPSCSNSANGHTL